MRADRLEALDRQVEDEVQRHRRGHAIGGCPQTNGAPVGAPLVIGGGPALSAAASPDRPAR